MVQNNSISKKSDGFGTLRILLIYQRKIEFLFYMLKTISKFRNRT